MQPQMAPIRPATCRQGHRSPAAARAPTGAFEVYYIAGNTLVGAASLGTVGLDWQLGGFAADPPPHDSSVGQLVQAMASFDGGAGGESLNVAPLGADMSQQTFLTAPQHA